MTNRPTTADDALARLMAGNDRFVRGDARFPTVQKEVLAELAKGQHPYATILGCSDSRVPPELLFDAGFGELFIVRVAGNVISAEVMGTLQYARVHLHTPLFVVKLQQSPFCVQDAPSSMHAPPVPELPPLPEVPPVLVPLDPPLPAVPPLPEVPPLAPAPDSPPLPESPLSSSSPTLKQPGSASATTAVSVMA